MGIIGSLYRAMPFSLYERLFPIYSRIRFSKEYREIIEILSKASDTDKEAEEQLSHMLDAGHIRFFYGDWIHEISRRDIEIDKSPESGEYRVRHTLNMGEGERYVYFPKWMNRNYCDSCYRNLLMEQNENSPHFYFSDVVVKRLSENGMILDIGCSEGIFTLEALGKDNRCISFEPDKRWKEPFSHTIGKDYGKRVKMVNRYVSDHSSENTVSIDDFFERSMPDDISVIKIDIEGEELRALKGMRKTLEANPSAVLLVCAYHAQNAEQEIRDFLEPLGYTVTPRHGYVFTYAMPGFDAPYIRHGVLEAVKE